MATFTNSTKSSTGYSILDSFALSSADGSVGWPFGAIDSIGQTFTASQNATVGRGSFYLARTSGSPTGTLRASIYAITGTPGTNGKPTGSALVTSDTVDESTLPVTSTLSDFEEIIFDFPTPLSVTSGTSYCFALDISNATGTIRVPQDSTAPADDGNGFFSSDNITWDGSFSSDVVFTVYFADGNSFVPENISKNSTSWSNVTKN